jgi:hypothetical protein
MTIDPEKLKTLRAEIREEFEKWEFGDDGKEDFRRAGAKIVEGLDALGDAILSETINMDEGRKIEMAAFIWEEVVGSAHFATARPVRSIFLPICRATGATTNFTRSPILSILSKNRFSIRTAKVATIGSHGRIQWTNAAPRSEKK